MSTISLKDMHLFHSIDRSLFSRLVAHLSRNPAESLLAMAFWLWLNEHRLPNLTTRLLKTSDFVVSKVADEAKICLDSLAPNQPIPSIISTAFTTTVVGKMVPLELMHRDKTSTINRICFFLNRICARIFTDILDQVLFADAAAIPYYERLNVPGFPHPLFGDVTILKLPANAEFPLDNNIW
ncbi:hypothetical protein RND81_10G150900 [Saponaria officinalis]|uniref:Uncharacterized protein n=1 Tax=Saponaria officinalis TaxID=3572 RepID=A0AAW1I2A2_SAPOF